ncbi:MAG: type I-E CRISPR-associated protein Cse1/CasA, partial [Actinomycetota bacterium]|nr:type I-E CRISPR-associated protein Cse1/CasA [Actinomycetota bacterium]
VDLDPALDPLQYAALHGLVTAILTDAAGPATDEDWEELFESGGLDAEVVNTYFDTDPAAWDLFDPVRPFMQVANLEPSKAGPRPVGALMPEVAAGNNTPVFSVFTDADTPAITFAEAARRLLATHAFDTAGIKAAASGDPAAVKGKTTGNKVGSLGQIGVIIPVGRTLFETLLLGCIVGPRRTGDAPAWRRTYSAEWETRPAEGMLDLLTWQSRRICLFPDQTPEGWRVTGAFVAAGDRFAVTPRLEPRTAWWAPKEGDDAEQYRPMRHLQGRAGWRGMAALVSMGHSSGAKYVTSELLAQAGRLMEEGACLSFDYPLSAYLVGAIYGVQSAVMDAVVADSIPLPMQALAGEQGAPLRAVLNEMVASAEAVRRALDGLDNNLREALGGERVPWNQGQHPGEILVSRLSGDATRLLRGLRSSPERGEEGLAAWQAVLNRTAGEIADELIERTYSLTMLGTGVESERPPMSPAKAEIFFRAALKKALPYLPAGEQVQTKEDGNVR